MKKKKYVQIGMVVSLNYGQPLVTMSYQRTRGICSTMRTWLAVFLFDCWCGDVGMLAWLLPTRF